MSARYSRILLCLLVIFLSGSLLSCELFPGITGDGTSGTNTLGQSSPTLDEWKQVSTGVELRYEHWTSSAKNDDTVTIVRLDPQQVSLSVGYQPENAPSLNEWMQQTEARVVINGGYFDESNRPTGLLVAEGQAYGASYNGFGGMLAIDGQGNISLRSLREQPYQPGSESIQHATQSSPMLVMGGKRTEFNANAVSDRRTVVAMDTQGRLLLIVSPGVAFTLDEMAEVLANSELGLETALNLDGGGSTGMYVNAGQQKVAVDPVTTLPIVIIAK